MRIRAIDGIGEVTSGTDLAALAVEHGDVADGDVVVITSKIVSKALGLATTRSRLDVIADGTDRVVTQRGSLSIVRTHHGLTLAAAGVDESNLTRGEVVPLPPDPDGVAREIRARIHELTGVTVAVVISDTAGRAWRLGQTDLAIGCAGLVPLNSLEGQTDSYGNPLMVTAPAVADEIASAAELATGKLGQRPISVISGLDPALLLDEDGPGAAALIRADDEDLFGLGARDAVLAAQAGQVVRGFPGLTEHEATTLDLVALAAPGNLVVTPSAFGFTIHADADHLIEAGMLKQRLVELAVAHGLSRTVDVEVV